MLQIGDFRLPLLGDVVQGTEAMIGNMIEGVIESVSGEKVELTPGTGVDNSRVEGARGKGDIKFEQKMTPHTDHERLRREVEKELSAIKNNQAKMEMRLKTEKQLRANAQPIVTGPAGYPQHGLPQQNATQNGMNPLMMLMLTRGNNQLQDDPLMLMMMMQQMGSGTVGQVNGQALQLDPLSFAMMQMFANAIASPPGGQGRAVAAPTIVPPQTGP